MIETFQSSRFLTITILLDVVLLTVSYSGILSIRVSPLVLAFGLLVISPSIAYAVVYLMGNEKEKSTSSR